MLAQQRPQDVEEEDNRVKDPLTDLQDQLERCKATLVKSKADKNEKTLTDPRLVVTAALFIYGIKFTTIPPEEGVVLMEEYKSLKTLKENETNVWINYNKGFTYWKLLGPSALKTSAYFIQSAVNGMCDSPHLGAAAGALQKGTSSSGVIREADYVLMMRFSLAAVYHDISVNEDIFHDMTTPTQNEIWKRGTLNFQNIDEYSFVANLMRDQAFEYAEHFVSGAKRCLQPMPDGPAREHPNGFVSLSFRSASGIICVKCSKNEVEIVYLLVCSAK